ncbi:outer membrane beta-barrel protein [soil metagenome]
MRSYLIGSASALCLLAAAPCALAQVYSTTSDQAAEFGYAFGPRVGMFARNANVSVLQRPHPEWDRRDVRFGSFLVRPDVVGSAVYDDNIFAQANGQADVVLIGKLGVLAESNWSRNYLSGFARVTGRGYADHDGENVADWTLGGNGRLDVGRLSSVQAGASYEQDTESRTSPSARTDAAEPVRYKTAKAYIGGVQEFSRLRVTAGLDVRDLRYENVAARGGGEIVETDRDRTSVTLATRGEYAVSGATSIIATVSANSRSYRLDSGPTSRDSDGVEASLGANFDLTNLIRGELAVGYSRQNYKSAGFDDIDGVSVRGNLQYFPTPLVTLSLTGSQSIEDTDFAGASGYLLTSVQFRADYEFRRNVILSGQLGYQTNKFNGTFDRDDKRPSAGVMANYRLNRAIGLAIGYDWLKQDSSGAQKGVNFSSNRVYVVTTYKF